MGGIPPPPPPFPPPPASTLGLTNLAEEKLALHGLYKPDTFKAALQNLMYVFIQTLGKRLRR